MKGDNEETKDRDALVTLLCTVQQGTAVAAAEGSAMVLYCYMPLLAGKISLYIFSLYKCKNVLFLCTAEEKDKGTFP